MLLLQIYYVCGLTMMQCMAAEGVLGVKYSHPSFENPIFFSGGMLQLGNVRSCQINFDFDLTKCQMNKDQL